MRFSAARIWTMTPEVTVGSGERLSPTTRHSQRGALLGLVSTFSFLLLEADIIKIFERTFQLSSSDRSD